MNRTNREALLQRSPVSDAMKTEERAMEPCTNPRRSRALPAGLPPAARIGVVDTVIIRPVPEPAPDPEDTAL
jgi:hypothetical protein